MNPQKSSNHKPVISLGLSFDFHDSSASIVIDGKLVASAVEERFTRNKHDANYPKFAIEHCLQQAEISIDEVDNVVLYEDPAKKWLRLLKSTFRKFPNTSIEFAESQRTWLGKKLWSEAFVSKRLNVPMSKISKVNHHDSHAAQAFVGSGLTNAAVLTIDAVGESATTTIHKAAWENGQPKFKKLLEIEYPHSLGLFYSAMTQFLGFKPMNDECTTMALAAFGKPIYADVMRKMVHIDGDAYTLSDKYFDFDAFLSSPFTEKFLTELGTPRDPRIKIHLSSFSEIGATKHITTSDQFYADVAASTQLVFEEIVEHLAKVALKLTGEKNLCFAGGAALNCVNNYNLLTKLGIENLFIPVEPGDGGASIGAAFLGYFQKTNGGKSAKQSSSQNDSAAAPSADSAASARYPINMGASYSSKWLQEFVNNLDIEHLSEYRKSNVKTPTRKWKTQIIEKSEKDLTDFVASEIQAGKVVGFFQNRFEIGPRALGQRSILFKPDSVELANKVSSQIKDRAQFRPYALSILEEDAQDILDIPSQVNKSSTLKWMQLAVPVKTEVVQKVRAGLHIDHTTRPQVVSASDNSIYHKVLSSIKEKSGVGAVINTSFNESGYPIVNSPLEAIHFFARTDMDTLVIENFIIQRTEEI